MLKHHQLLGFVSRCIPHHVPISQQYDTLLQRILLPYPHLNPQSQHVIRAMGTSKSHKESRGKQAPVIEFEGAEYSVLQEGRASILVPKGALGKNGKLDQDTSVFYNPVQQFNRDLTVLAIRAYHDQLPENGRRKIDRKRKRDDLEGDKIDKDSVKAPKTAAQATPQTTTDSEGLPPADDTGINHESGNSTNNVTASPANELTGNKVSTEASSKNQSAPDGSSPQNKRRFTILDALSATGLRAIRYARELPFVTSVTANDMSLSAVDAIQLNTRYNEVSDKVVASHDDALAHMYRRAAESMSARIKNRMGNKESQLYDVVDLDPYGTAAPFIDAALSAVRDDGGLLCVTCTDSGVWAGQNYAEKCFAMYGGVPSKGSATHEVGVRLILHSIATAAARHQLAIEPLLSLSIDFYVRIFIRVTKSPLAVKFLASKTMTVYSCDNGCGAFETQYVTRARPVPTQKPGKYMFKHSIAQGPSADRHCQQCGSKTHLTGPMYGGHMHSPDFIHQMSSLVEGADRSIYGTVPRMEGMLQTALEEIMPSAPLPEEVDTKERAAAAIDPCPLFMMPAKLSSAFKSSTPNDAAFRGALRHLGYNVTRSHCKPGSIKTDAPWSTIMFIMREWIRQKSPVTTANVAPGSIAWKLLRLDEETKTAEAEVETEAEGAGDADKTTDKAKGEVKGEDSGKTEEELRKTLKFDHKLDQLGMATMGKRLLRYQHNPQENWGPMARARCKN